MHVRVGKAMIKFARDFLAFLLIGLVILGLYLLAGPFSGVRL
jgi:hypothetical protein